MNRVTSSSSSNPQTKKLHQSHSNSHSQPQPPPKKEKNLKRERFPANPLRGFSTTRSSVSSNGSGSGSTSSEGFRFLLSHSSSSSLGTNRALKFVAKTPKSAPVVSKPLIRKKPRFLEETKLKSIVTEKPRRCKTTTSVLKKQSTVCKGLKVRDRQTSIRVDDSIGKITPVSKLGTDLSYGSNGEAMDDCYKERTPPVQASVSPEIQCGSSMNISVSAQSEACYAAGHLLSGVRDKRKCKPKGILTVGEEFGKAKILDEFEDNGESYMMPLPVDASVHWLLSPCDEEKEEQIVEFVGSDRSTCSDLCNISRGRSLSPMSICKEKVRRTSSSLSPNELSRFRRFMQLSSSECLKGNESSPLSVDTLGSENVIQTPESNSSFERFLSSQGEFQKKHDVSSDLESLTMTLQSAGLSPEEPSFKFDSLTTSSVSIDLSHFQTTSADMSSCHSHSYMPEMKLQGITDTEVDKRNHKERELLQCSVAESISTDGGGLICSEDSNWMACYKNNFLYE